MGPASTQRKDPVDALRYATQMLGKGYADVVIVDLAENGQAYPLTPFAWVTRAREAGRRDAARPARAAWVVQRLLAARW
jgi:hypothetical protein